MVLQKATQNDYESVVNFYNDVIDRTPNISIYAQWRKGAHPTSEALREYINKGNLFVYKAGSNIIGAMVLTMCQSETYRSVEWPLQLNDDEVAEIHLLAVSPDFQCGGIGSKMIHAALSLAKENFKKAVRLDTLDSNTPDRLLYQRLGFEFCGKKNLYAENTGWIDFCFFEYKL